MLVNKDRSIYCTIYYNYNYILYDMVTNFWVPQANMPLPHGGLILALQVV